MAEIPKRVTEYISRVRQCIDWGKELHSGMRDPARAAIVTRAIQALDCKHLHLETDYLQRHYDANSPAGQAANAATLEWENSLKSENPIKLIGPERPASR